MKITKKYLEKLIKEQIDRAGISARASSMYDELDQEEQAEKERQTNQERELRKKYPAEKYIPKIMDSRRKPNKKQATKIYNMLIQGTSFAFAVDSVMGKETADQQSNRDKISSRADSAYGELERSQEVLKIISPRTPADTIRMTGSGQNMQLNGVKVPPKYIPYILKGGELPK